MCQRICADSLSTPDGLHETYKLSQFNRAPFNTAKLPPPKRYHPVECIFSLHSIQRREQSGTNHKQRMHSHSDLRTSTQAQINQALRVSGCGGVYVSKCVYQVMWSIHYIYGVIRSRFCFVLKINKRFNLRIHEENHHFNTIFVTHRTPKPILLYVVGHSGLNHFIYINSTKV